MMKLHCFVFTLIVMLSVGSLPLSASVFGVLNGNTAFQNVECMSRTGTSIWLATGQGRLVKVHGLTGSEELKRELPAGAGQVFAMLSSGDSLWIAASGGLYMLNSAGGEFLNHWSGADLGLESDTIFSLRNSNGMQYLGGQGEAVVRDLRNDRTVLVLRRDSLRGVVHSFFPQGNQLFLGTAGSGLWIYNTLSKTWRHPDILDGWKADAVYDIVADGQKLWLATDLGLWQYNLALREFSPKGRPRLLQSLQFLNHNLLLVGADSLWLLKGDSLQVLDSLDFQQSWINNVVQTEDHLVIATDGGGLYRWLPDYPLIHLKHLYNLPDGMELEFSEDIFPALSLEKIHAWFSDMPGALFQSYQVTPRGETNRFRAELPRDLTGKITFEFMVRHSSGTYRKITREIIRDNAPPILFLDPYPFYTSEISLSFSGRVEEDQLSALMVQPNNLRIKTDTAGNFGFTLPLEMGRNNFQLEAVNQAGHKVVQTISLVSDPFGPELRVPAIDTVYSSTHTIKGTVQEAFLARLQLEPAKQASIVLLDSLVQMEFFHLKPGYNQFLLQATDSAGNQEAQNITLIMPGSDRLPEASQRDGIKYRVQEGDTWDGIAMQFYGHLSWSQVLQRNHLENKQSQSSALQGTAYSPNPGDMLQIIFPAGMVYGSPAPATDAMMQKATEGYDEQ